jgi:DNA replicative helicase MCM subunit Mcm2 (Cdc46/Mcm family)
MDISKLNLPPFEQRTLESTGFATVEQIALCYGEELGLGRKKGDAIVARARNLLAKEKIKAIDCGDDSVTVVLADTHKSTIVSVEYFLGAIGSDLKRVTEGDRLIIFRPQSKPCSLCGVQPVYVCRVCQASLCRECRYKHEHEYYQAVEIAYLEQAFRRVQEKAEAYIPVPGEKRAEKESKPSEEVVSLAREMGFQGFADSFFSDLEGNDIMKQALTCALFSRPKEPVHVLLLGDPAGGKTLAREVIASKLGSDVELVGANVTRAGLVCNLATGDKGVLAYADGKLVLVDEFDKIPEQDIDYCLELLSNGKCSVHSARVHETIESHFVMIAFANPIGTVFRGKPMDEIGLPPILLSRFAFIVKVEELDAERRKELIKRKLLGKAETQQVSERLLSWLREAHKHHPKVTATESEIDAYSARVNKLIDQYMGTSLRRDLRMADYAMRIPVAMARATFSDVDGATLEKAATLMEAALEAWQR